MIIFHTRKWRKYANNAVFPAQDKQSHAKKVSNVTSVRFGGVRELKLAVVLQ